MEKLTLAEKIKDITQKHLETGNGLLFGQCVTAVGWVNGTVPDCKNIIELPMTDVAGAGFAVGAAIVGRRPIFVLRFQDFFTLNCNQIVHYAAISKELHEQGIPVFIRCIGLDSAGPVHSVILHNIAMYFPGMLVCSPMTPGEYEEAWRFFMENDQPLFVSEHRRAYQNTEEWKNVIYNDAEITLYAISDARMEMMEAAEKLLQMGIRANVIHIMYLKPLQLDNLVKPLLISKNGLVIDNGFPDCGAARSIAYELAEKTGFFVHALATEDHVKCFNPAQQNKTPNADKIVSKVLEILGKK